MTQKDNTSSRPPKRKQIFKAHPVSLSLSLVEGCNEHWLKGMILSCDYLFLFILLLFILFSFCLKIDLDGFLKMLQTFINLRLRINILINE